MNDETIRFDLISNEFYSFRFSICKFINLFVFGCCLLLLFLFGITNEKCLSKFEKKKNAPLDVSNTCLQKKHTEKSNSKNAKKYHSIYWARIACLDQTYSYDTCDAHCFQESKRNLIHLSSYLWPPLKRSIHSNSSFISHTRRESVSSTISSQSKSQRSRSKRVFSCYRIAEIPLKMRTY